MRIRSSMSGVRYTQVALSRFTDCVIHAWSSTVRNSLGLYLGEQNVKGGKDQWKVEAEIQHDCPHWWCRGGAHWQGNMGLK